MCIVSCCIGYSILSKFLKQSYPICTFLNIHLTKLGVLFLSKITTNVIFIKTKGQTMGQHLERTKRRYKISLLVGFIGYLFLFWGDEIIYL